MIYPAPKPKGKEKKTQLEKVKEYNKRQASKKTKKMRVFAPLHAYVIKRDGKRCRICGQSNYKYCDGWGVEVHHIVPKSLGGKDVEGNLICICSQHHTWGPDAIHSNKSNGSDHIEELQAMIIKIYRKEKMWRRLGGKLIGFNKDGTGIIEKEAEKCNT